MEDQLQLPVLPRAGAGVSVAPPGIAPAVARPRSPMPGLVIAAIGIVAGGALLIRAALGLPDDLWGRLDGGGLADARLLGMAGSVAAGGMFAVGQALLRRGRADRTAVLVCLAVALPLATFAAAAAAMRPGPVPDRRLDDPWVPYTFTYPGTWRQDSPQDVHQTSDERWVTGVSKQTINDVKQGLVLVATDRVSPGKLVGWMLKSEQQGARITGRYTRTVAGYEALTVDYERVPGRGFRSRTGMVVGRTAFIFTCVLEEDPEQAKAGCEKVLDTFAFKGKVAPPAARAAHLD